MGSGRDTMEGFRETGEMTFEGSGMFAVSRLPSSSSTSDGTVKTRLVGAESSKRHEFEEVKFCANEGSGVRGPLHAGDCRHWELENGE